MTTSTDALLDSRSAAVRGAKDFVFGSAAGMAAKVFEHPFDLTKVRLQAQVLDSMARFNGPIDCLAKTWRNEGARGLYRGLPAPLVGSMAENACLFLAYGNLQSFIRWSLGQPASSPLSLSQLALAGGGAGAFTSVLLTPIELVKCKMQVQMLLPSSLALASSSPLSVHSRLPGPISVLSTIIRTTGFRGLWLGHTGTLIRETGGSAAWFASKEFVASLLVSLRTPSADGKKDTDLAAWESALSGACAGIAYNVALFPADTIKSSIQTEEELRPRSSSLPRPTFIGMARDVWKKQGLKGLYAGCGITVLRSVPSSGMIFLIYDGLVHRYG